MDLVTEDKEFEAPNPNVLVVSDEPAAMAAPCPTIPLGPVTQARLLNIKSIPVFLSSRLPLAGWAMHTWLSLFCLRRNGVTQPIIQP